MHGLRRGLPGVGPDQADPVRHSVLSRSLLPAVLRRLGESLHGLSVAHRIRRHVRHQRGKVLDHRGLPSRTGFVSRGSDDDDDLPPSRKPSRGDSRDSGSVEEGRLLFKEERDSGNSSDSSQHSFSYQYERRTGPVDEIELAPTSFRDVERHPGRDVVSMDNLSQGALALKKSRTMTNVFAQETESDDEASFDEDSRPLVPKGRKSRKRGDKDGPPS